MKRPQYVFRPQLSIPDHRKAWAYLQQMPANQRKDFLVRAILAEEQREAFKQMLQEVIREELIRGVVIQELPNRLQRKRCPNRRWIFWHPFATDHGIAIVAHDAFRTLYSMIYRCFL